MIKLMGTVVKKPWAVGTKSEHEAVVLETKDKDYVLRRKGGNPFQDPELDRHVGGFFAFEGELINDYIFVIEDL